jgi:hypothetical protein
VRRKWTYAQKRQRGRPPIDAELEQWILRVAQDNPGLGYDKLKGELRKLGFRVSPTTIRTVLERHGILPAPERSRSSSSWRTFLSHWIRFKVAPVRLWWGAIFVGQSELLEQLRTHHHSGSVGPGLYLNLPPIYESNFWRVTF